jgi:hypothetical protein
MEGKGGICNLGCAQFVCVDTISGAGAVFCFAANEVVGGQGVNKVMKPVALASKVGVDLGGSVCREEYIRK